MLPLPAVPIVLQQPPRFHRLSAPRRYFPPFTYNISYGIAFGLISYVLIRIFTGKIREVKVGTWVITILFLLMLFLTH